MTGSPIALVTDSASQLSPSLADRFGTIVVPVTVTLAGVDHLEGVDLTVDDFYQQLSDSPNAELSTTQPSAAAFAAAFESAIADGAAEILAIVVGSAYSGAVNSAEVAARAVVTRHAGVTIDVFDSGTASFGIACAVWAAADAIAGGHDLAAVKRAAADRAVHTSSVFVIDGLDLARRSGRFGAVDFSSASNKGVAVLSSGPAGLEVVGDATSAADAIDLMVGFLAASAQPIRTAVGWASPELDQVTATFRKRLRAEPSVVEVVDYRVGPSIAVHTGPNTVGAFMFPG